MIKFVDMFSGIGGFREGLTRAGGFTCVGHCEIDKYANRSYNALFDTKGEWFIEDARKADPSTIKKEETNNVSNPIRTADEREQYRDLIRENIEYDILAKNNPADRIRLDELVELMLDTVCSKRSSIRIAGDEFPTEVVKSRFLKLEAQHIQYVLDSLKDNPPHIHNIKKYLLAALYNAPLTIENYYAAQINHDLYGRNRGDVNWK